MSGLTKKQVIVAAIAALASSWAAAAPDLTHDYPSRPLRFLVPSAAGESADIIGRVMAGALSRQLGQQVAIQNRSADRDFGVTEMGARAKADGYTLILGNMRTHVLGPLALELAYDPEEDFDPVTQVAAMPYVLAVAPVTQAVSVQELFALAKSRSTPLRYSSAGDPLGHLGMQMLKNISRADAVRVRAVPASPAELGQRADVEVFFASARFVLPYVNSGALRAIAVSSPKRAAALPGVPTIAESGHVGFDVTDWFAFFVPRGAAAETIHRLHVGLVNAALTESVKQALRRNGAESVTSISNIEVLQRVRSDSAKYAKVLAGVNFKPDVPGK